MNKEEQSSLAEWLKTQPRCAICWWPKDDNRRAHEVHHICGGYSRSKGNDPRNYLLTCERCHGVYHSGKIYGLYPDLVRSAILWAKRESDPGNYDPEYLAWLKNKKHLGYDPAPIPDYYLNERKENSAPWNQRNPWPQ